MRSIQKFCQDRYMIKNLINHDNFDQFLKTQFHFAMKKLSMIGLTAVLFFSLAFSVTAQDLETKENKGIVRKNAIRLNWFPQLSYDRLLWQKGNHHIGATVGTLVFYRNEDLGFGLVKRRLWNSFSSLGVYHLYGKRNHYLETSLQYGLMQGQELRGNWSIGQKTTNGYRISGGGSFDADRTIDQAEIRKLQEQGKDYIIDYSTVKNLWETWATARIGYRYQRSEGGFLFRAGFGFLNILNAGNLGTQSKVHWGKVDSGCNCNDSVLWLLNLDMSLGWSF